MYKPYAGIGGRNTPDNVLKKFTSIGQELASLGYTLRSGGADGADSAFELGYYHMPASSKEIYRPWKGFNNNKSEYYLRDINKELEKICIDIYGDVRWEIVKKSVRLLHARNVFQILGGDLCSKSLFVVCWTDRPANDTGGTQFGLHLAKKLDIPTYNFYYRQEEEAFNNMLEGLKKGASE